MQDLDDATAEAAALLSASALPVIAGMRTDVAGAIAALKLAERIGAVVDHAAAEAILRDQAVLQDAGLMRISPAEARRVADTFLIVGDGPLQAWPDLIEFLAGGAAPEERRAPKLIGLCSGRIESSRGDAPVTSVNCDSDALPGAIAALRARINGRPLSASFDAAEVDGLAALLKAARFGVAVWSPDDLDAPAIEMLVGLIKDLNEKTRWSGFSITADATAAGVSAACAWVAGLPLRTSFARGDAGHDPWRFAARRLVEAGETDTVLWIGNDPPTWLGNAKSIVLAGEETPAATKAHIAIGTPGVDHDAIVHDRLSATLVQVKASAPSQKPSAADVLTRIAARLDAP